MPLPLATAQKKKEHDEGKLAGDWVTNTQEVNSTLKEGAESKAAPSSPNSTDTVQLDDLNQYPPLNRDLNEIIQEWKSGKISFFEADARIRQRYPSSSIFRILSGIGQLNYSNSILAGTSQANHVNSALLYPSYFKPLLPAPTKQGPQNQDSSKKE